VRVRCVEWSAKLRHTLRKKVRVGRRCGFSVNVCLFFSTGTSSMLSHRGDMLTRSRANHRVDIKAKDVWVCGWAGVSGVA
jgi:hypothetical protein